jgi:hypothetical protein
MRWFLISFLFVFNFSALGQQKQTYFEGKELKQYEGEWIGTNGTDTFKVILQFKEKHRMGPNLSVDAIYGWHCYTKNGIKESNTIVYPLNIKKTSIIMGKAVNGKIFMTFNDNQRNKGSAEISFTMVPGTNNTKAVWKIEKIKQQEGNILILTDKKTGKPFRSGTPESEYPVSKITSVPEWTMKKVN